MCHGTCTGTVCGIEVYQENERTIIARGARGGHYLMRLFPYALPGSG